MSWVRRIDKERIHPGLVSVMELTLSKLKDAGTPFKVYSGLRTFEEQDKLYAKGRSIPGRIVTKARGGQSMHNYGLAVDLAPFNLLTPEEWDLHWPNPHEAGNIWFDLESTLQDSATELDSYKNDGVDYEWGGRWKFKDVPHVQVRTTLREIRAGHYPHVEDIEWSVVAHTSFLYDTAWIRKRVQRMMSELGFSVGPIDGIVGRKTKDALRMYANTREITKCVVEDLVRDFQTISKVV